MSDTNDPHERNAALEFFGLPKEPEPEVAQAADAQAARLPDPTQATAAEQAAQNARPTSTDPVTFFGLNSHNPAWTNLGHLI